MFRFLYLVLFFTPTLTLVSQALFAQTGCDFSVTLIVKDDHTQELLANAAIYVTGINKLYTTNDNGKVVIGKLCKGEYSLRITHVGCDDTTLKIKLEQNYFKEIYLHHVKVELGEVVVTDVKKDATSNKTTLKGTEVFQTAGLNFAQSLQKVNGVRILTTGTNIAKPVIHGLHSNRIAIVNNGLKLESQQWGADHAPEINPMNASKFTVLKGASAIRYGAEAIAGVVITEPKPMPLDKGLQGELNGAIFSNNLMGMTHALIEGSNGKATNLSWRVGATAKKGGNQRIPNFWLANTGMEELSINTATQFKKNRLTLLFNADYFTTTIGLYPGAHVENVADLNNAIKSPVPLTQQNFTYQIGRPSQQATHFTAKLKADYVWQSNHHTTITVAQQENKREEFDPRSFITLPEMSLSLGTTTAEVVHNIRFTNHLVLDAGLHYSFQQNSNNATSSRIFIRNYQTDNKALFTNLTYKQEKWLWDVGVRLDDKWFESYYKKNDTLTIHQRNFTNFSFATGFRINVAKYWNIGINAGTAFRPPAPNELYANGLHQGLASIEIGNQDFKTEKAINMALQIEYKRDSSFALDISVYNTAFNNFIFLEPSLQPALTIRGLYPVFNYKQANANFTGLDVTCIFAPIKSWQLTFKGNIVYARNKQLNDWLILMPPDRYELRLKKQLHKKYWLQPYIEAGVAYTLQQRRIPTVYTDYTLPPQAYTLVDIEAGTILTKSGIHIGLSVYNLLNTSYRDYLNRLRYFANEAGINGVLRIKVPFKIK